MIGENNQQKLLKSIKPMLDPREFVFCTIPFNQIIYPDLNPICRFEEKEGVTLILEKPEAENNNLNYTYPCKMITLEVHSSLEAVGFLAAITSRLAEQGISVNPVSAYYHDHLFVPVSKAEQTMKILDDCRYPEKFKQR